MSVKMSRHQQTQLLRCKLHTTYECWLHRNLCKSEKKPTCTGYNFEQNWESSSASFLFVAFVAHFVAFGEKTFENKSNK